MGAQYDLISEGHSNIYTKLTWGGLHGYKEPYHDRIPFNNYGVAPVLIPALGFDYSILNTEVSFFSYRGLMISIGVYVF